LKITIFGLTISSSWGNGHATPYRAILRALHRRGHRVTFFEKDVPYYAARRDFAHCSYCNLVLYQDWESIRRRALAEAGDSDVVMVASYCPHGAHISDDVLALPGPLRVFYDLDTPITLQSLELGDLDYLRADQIPGFDLYLSFTGGKILDVLCRRWKAQQVGALFGCVDPNVHTRVAPRADFTSVLSYMGTYAPDRQRKLETLFLEPARRLPKSPCVLAGSLYPREWVWPANVCHIEHVPPEGHSALYSSSRLTLNITRDGMARYGYCPSGRFFEAAACATPLVTDWWYGLDTFFTPGEELFVAAESADVVEALTSSDRELRIMAGRARERTLAEHTGDHRAAQLLEHFERAMAPLQRALASD